MIEGFVFLAVFLSTIFLARKCRSHAAKLMLHLWAILPLYAGLGFLAFWAMQCEVDWIKGNLCSQALLVRFGYGSTLLTTAAATFLLLPVGSSAATIELRTRYHQSRR